MYCEYFELDRLPFSLTPDTDFFCGLPGHRAALNVLLMSLAQGEGFIKIIGEVGTGKTLLCRQLLNNLPDNYVSAYIPNPDLSPLGIRQAVADELAVERQSDDGLLASINEKLLLLHGEGKQVVLLIDESQALTDDALEAVRLLTNLETESKKLLQVVLFAQPELDDRLSLPHLRQLKQRIAFSYNLHSLNKDEFRNYIQYRLLKAGCSHAALFTDKAIESLYRLSNGVPRVANTLAHRALISAYGAGKAQVSHDAIYEVLTDPDESSRAYGLLRNILVFGLVVLTVALCYQLGRTIFPGG